MIYWVSEVITKPVQNFKPLSKTQRSRHMRFLHEWSKQFKCDGWRTCGISDGECWEVSLNTDFGNSILKNIEFKLYNQVISLSSNIR
ncbi:hypothetical protein RIR_jg8768.t1 [Rhizophagus irregularis DAOM 181602=DAOM 197198]|nr:hypothetical protein RIR_jg8768.t1 [Rhizophagus irregularis DAOM 181602=DAOM 197198]